MPRLFVDPGSVDGDRLLIRGAGARHLAGSLRMTPGDPLIVVHEGEEIVSRIDAASVAEVQATVVERHPATGEPPLHLEVIQALTKERFEDAIDSMVQCGASVIRPVITERCVARPGAAAAARRLERWRAVARESAQLAYRARVPAVEPLRSLENSLADVADRLLLAAVISDRSEPLGEVAIPKEGAVICIGPEGGLSGADLEQLDAAGALHVSLGGRVLRSRLAASIALTMILNRHPGSPGPSAHIDG